MEGDVIGLAPCMMSRISTHALTWRATPGTESNWNINQNFYPRPHMEGDIPPPARGGKNQQFLPTPSHGGRPDAWRDHEPEPRISTHALTWRATLLRAGAFCVSGISTHALRVEGDFRAVPIHFQLDKFYPRPPRRGRRIWLASQTRQKLFLPTPSA